MAKMRNNEPESEFINNNNHHYCSLIHRLFPLKFHYYLLLPLLSIITYLRPSNLQMQRQIAGTHHFGSNPSLQHAVPPSWQAGWMVPLQSRGRRLAWTPAA